ncbi:MAG: DUF3108 domain-containing protein [Parvibaculaceae bacterium]|nr:DUF3108 domain-containing protein [Parvibaculaceae bacterium]
MALSKHIFAGGAVFGTALLLSAATAPAATDPAEDPAPAPNISADYTIYIGGFMAAEGSIDAALTDDGYFVKSHLGIAGMPARFYNAKWNMTSEGELAESGLRPSRFAFVSDEKGTVKHREITYDASGLPTPVFDPPEEDLEEVLPFERRNAVDPVSALLLPVAAGGNPCDRRIPVFDGKRRYDLQLSYDREDQVTTRNEGYSGNAIVCSVHVNPRTGMRKGKFTTMLQQRDNTQIWLAEIEGEDLYIPVRIQLRTPIGAAVMDVVKLRHDPRDRAGGIDTAMK